MPTFLRFEIKNDGSVNGPGGTRDILVIKSGLKIVGSSLAGFTRTLAKPRELEYSHSISISIESRNLSRFLFSVINWIGYEAS